jgi:hypothetical protein
MSSQAQTAGAVIVRSTSTRQARAPEVVAA